MCKTFYEFWFEEPPGHHTQFASDASSIPVEVEKKTKQMVGLLRTTPNHQLLVTIIKRALALDFFPQATKAAGINPVALASVRRRCEMMCKCLLENILQVNIDASCLCIAGLVKYQNLTSFILPGRRTEPWRGRRASASLCTCFACFLSGGSWAVYTGFRPYEVCYYPTAVFEESGYIWPL